MSKKKKVAFEGYTLEEMPDDLLEVLAIEATDMPVGLEMLKKCEEVRKKYPEFFKSPSKEKLSGRQDN